MDDVEVQDSDLIDPNVNYEELGIKDQEQARLKAVNICYDTPKHLKRELTRLNSYEAGAMAGSEAFDKLVEHIASGSTTFFSFQREYLDAMYSLRRSVGGLQQESLRKLAEASLLVDNGENTSGPAWQG